MIYRLAIIFTLLVIRAGAVPVGPTPPVDLQGEVKKWAWIDGTVSKSSGDGMLTSIKTVPTYYIVLKVAGLSQKTRDSLSYYASSQGKVAIMHPIAGIELEDDEILISLDLELIDTLKKGSKIEIKGYTMQGDEWGCASEWSSMKLDGNPVPKRNRQAEQDGARQPATAPVPKSKGKDKPKPESEGRSQ